MRTGGRRRTFRRTRRPRGRGRLPGWRRCAGAVPPRTPPSQCSSTSTSGSAEQAVHGRDRVRGTGWGGKRPRAGLGLLFCEETGGHPAGHPGVGGIQETRGRAPRSEDRHATQRGGERTLKSPSASSAERSVPTPLTYMFTRKASGKSASATTGWMDRDTGEDGSCPRAAVRGGMHAGGRNLGWLHLR